MAQETNFDCIVIGGGPTGLATAAAIANLGLAVAVAGAELEGGATSRAAAAPLRPQDLKTAALFPPSIAILRSLGAWEAVQPASAAMTAIRLVDDTGGLLRAPEVLFHARELGLQHLAYNVPNAALTAALADVAVRAGAVLHAGGRASAIRDEGDGCTVALADGSRLRSHFIVGSDGRQSPARAAAGIATKHWPYEQSALITTFSHSRSHGGISTELHGPAGPCTTVPLPDRVSSLVWVDRPGFIERQMAASPTEFVAALTARLGGLLGKVEATGSRRSFPMSGLLAERMAKGRIALVGEAGHALPPIGAQGLNLGLADVAVLVDAIARWKVQPKGTGPELELARYADFRDGDIRRRAGAVDLLNRTLESGSPALRLVRGAGLHILAALPGMRRMLMARGLEPPEPLPRLMQDGSHAPDGSGLTAAM